jgi:acyl-CoA thioester hydrolase
MADRYGAAMDDSAATAIEAPFVADRIAVRPEWIDSNGHMNVAYYVRAFDLAFDAIYERLGLGSETLKAVGASTFAAEMHITYQREVLEGDPLRITTQLLGFDAKRAHYIQCMYHAREGYLAATNEWLILYIDMTRRRVGTMPEALQQRMARVLDAHAGLPLPPEAGRRISLSNRPAR